DAGASASKDQRKRTRRGSRTMVAAKANPSAIHEPRENVKYKAVTSTGVAAEAKAAYRRRRQCAATPTTRIRPIAASNPKEFQYPTGRESRYALNGSSGE